MKNTTEQLQEIEITDLHVAEQIFYALGKDISVWSRTSVSYGEHKFTDKEIKAKVMAVRKSYFHNGSEAAIQKFLQAEKELKQLLKKRS